LLFCLNYYVVYFKKSSKYDIVIVMKEVIAGATSPLILILLLPLNNRFWIIALIKDALFCLLFVVIYRFLKKNYYSGWYGIILAEIWYLSDI